MDQPNLAVFARTGTTVVVFVLLDVPQGEAIDLAQEECRKREVRYVYCARCSTVIGPTFH